MTLGLVLGPAADSCPAIVSWTQAVKETSETNLDLASSRKSLRRAQFQKANSISSFLPSLSLRTSYSRSGETEGPAGGRFAIVSNSLDSDSASLSLSASQDLFNGFRNLAGLKRTQAQLRSAEADEQNSRASVGLELERAYHRLLFAQNQVLVSGNIAVRRAENSDLVKLRFNAGREHKGSLLQTQARASQARFEASKAARDLGSASAELARVMGRKSDLNLRVEGNFNFPNADSNTPKFESLALDIPSVVKSRNQIEASRASVISSRASFLPTFGANASVSTSDTRVGGLAGPLRGGSWSLGVSGTLPLFNGGSNRWNYLSARSDWKRSQDSYEATLERAVVSLRNDYLNFIDAIERNQVRQQFLEASELRSEIGRTSYTQGRLGFTSWDQIETELINAQKSALSSQRDARLAWASWQRALGKGPLP